MRIETVVQSGHYLHISDIAFSPDGSTMATCSPDESVRLWDIAMGCETAVLKGHRGPVYNVVFNHDASLLASCSWDLTVRIWDPVSRSCKFVLDSSDQKGVMSIDKICFNSSGNKILSAGMYRFKEPPKVIVWDTGSGKRVKDYEISEDGVSALAWSPDEKLVAVATTGIEQLVIRIIEAESGATVHYLTHKFEEDVKAKDGIRYAPSVSIAFSSDSAYLYFACKKKLYQLRIGGDGTAVVVPVENDVFKVELRDDGNLVLFGKNVTLIDKDRKPTDMIDVSASEMNRKGDLLARSNGRSLELIDRHSGQVIRTLGSRMRMAEQIGNLQRQFVIAANQVYPVIASGAPDGLVRLWDLRKAGGPVIIRAHEFFIDAICFDPMGKFLVTCGDATVKFWSVSDGKLLHTIDITGGIRSMHFSADATALLLGGNDGRVIVINPGTAEIHQEQKHHKGTVEAVLFLPSGEMLSAGMDELCLWNDFSLSKHQSLGLPFPVNCLASSQAGMIALGGGNTKWFGMQQGIDITGTVSLFHPRAGYTHHLKGHSAAVKAVAFDPEGSIVAAGGADGRLIAWEVESGKQLFSVDAHAGDVTGVCFTSDGSFIASIGLDTAVRLWETTSGKIAATLLSLNDEDYVAITDEGYYSATKAALRSVMFRRDNRIFPFDQFDLQLNRPDKYLQRLGFALPQLIDAYGDAHARRIKHFHFHTNGIDAAGSDPPQLKIVSPIPIGVAPSREIDLTIEVTSGSTGVDRLLVYCNDVPVYGQGGLDINSLGSSGQMSLRLQLMTGDNKVQLCAVDKNGIESPKSSFRSVFAGDQMKPKLLLLCVGVSKYGDSRYNLDYAAKDAEDLGKAFASSPHRFSEIKARVLTDGAASRTAILESRAFLQNTDIDDHVVLLFAGHGTIRNLDYYFLPADFSIDNIEETSITYDEIQSLLDCIPARRRIVLLDTCHAGEPEDFDGGDPQVPLGKGVKARALREIQFSNVPKQQKKRTRLPVLDRLTELFADLRRDSGANVIAAAAAMEYARELDKVSNGVFTSCVLDALRNVTADKDQDGTLTVSELHRFVTKKVVELTAGQQRPISRRENITDDFPVI